ASESPEGWPASAGLAETIDELVCAAADGGVEDIGGPVVGGVGHRVRLSVEDEARGLHLCAQRCALDAMQGLDLGVSGALSPGMVDDDEDPAGLERRENGKVHPAHIGIEGRDVEVMIFLA